MAALSVKFFFSAGKAQCFDERKLIRSAASGAHKKNLTTRRFRLMIGQQLAERDGVEELFECSGISAFEMHKCVSSCSRCEDNSEGVRGHPVACEDGESGPEDYVDFRDDEERQGADTATSPQMGVGVCVREGDGLNGHFEEGVDGVVMSFRCAMPWNTPLKSKVTYDMVVVKD